jgi:hypothetical protein
LGERGQEGVKPCREWNHFIDFMLNWNMAEWNHFIFPELYGFKCTFFEDQRETSISIWEKTSDFPLECSLNGSNDVCAMIDSWTKTSWGMVIDRFIGILRICTLSPVAWPWHARKHTRIYMHK